MTMTITRLKERGKWGTFMSQCLRSLTLMLFFFIQTTLLCANATLENSDEFTCYARFEHVNVKHTDCGKRNGKLIVDPNVNAGTRMPYRVRYQYNGQWYWKGPFTSWGDSYISNLPAGTYRNVTLVDARNCKYNAGHFKIKENCANRCTAKFEHVNVKHADCGQSNGKIIVDPNINSGTKLPFYVKFTYNGILYQFGPFRKNRDYAIKNLSAGIYRNVTLIDANGCEDNEGNVEIRSKGGLKDGGYVSKTQRGCAPFDPAPFTGSKIDGDVKYQWQIKRDRNGQWENIGGANSKNYDPGVHQVGSVWYRRAARMAGCGDWAYSNSVDIHVNEPCIKDCTVDLGPNQELCDGAIVLKADVDGQMTDCAPCDGRDLSTMMHLGTYDGQEYYKVLSGDVKYPDAYAFAANRGGSLPIIRNGNQNAWLAQKVGGRFWLGLTDTQNEGTFKWIDGSALTYTNWNNNEPNDWDSGEDFVEMLTNGKWNDLGDHHIRWIVVSFPVCDPNQVGPKYQWAGPDNYVSSEANIEVTNPGQYCLTITDCNGTVCSDCVEITGGYLADGGRINRTQRGCAPFDPAPFIGSEVAGEVTYQWQIKRAMNGQWENIDAANGKDYDPGVHPEGSVWYRRAVRINHSCGTWKYSNSVDIHVKGAPVVTVTSTDPGCGAEDGTITFSFDDRSGRTNIEFKIVSEETVLGHFDQNNSKDDAGAYTIDGLAAGTYQLYTRWGNNECEVDLGVVILEGTFEDLKDGGRINSTQRGCAPFDPVPFTGSEVAGEVTYQWQIKRAMNGQWENIDAANGKDYDPGVHPEGSVWYRRAVRINHSCGTWKYSNSVDIHVKGAPMVTVTSTDPGCDVADGTITFSFEDRSDRTNIEFKIVSEGLFLATLTKIIQKMMLALTPLMV